MLVIGQTRFGNSIIMAWCFDETGEMHPDFQEFEHPEEVFDAAAVYGLLAARWRFRRLRPNFEVLYLLNAEHYEDRLPLLINTEALAADLNIFNAFDRARYAETLLDVAFKG